jgi:hypothetical protein
MGSDIASDSSITQDATNTITPGLDLPDASWDEGRLLDYMRRHDRAVVGLERTSLQHEYCFGAAAQLKYEQLGGKWTQWAKDQGYPKETFRRRRLLFVRAGSPQALDKFPGKMEAYYDLGIYRKPTQKKMDALDARWEAKATASRAQAEPLALGRVEDATGSHGGGDEASVGAVEETLMERLAVPDERPGGPTAAEILGKVVNLLMEAERVGVDDSCPSLLAEIATILGRLGDTKGRKGVAA